MSSELHVVGKFLPRLDGPTKVAGVSGYIADLGIPGCWIAGVLRSDIPAGRLKGIRKKTSFDWSKVVLQCSLCGSRFIRNVIYYDTVGK